MTSKLSAMVWLPSGFLFAGRTIRRDGPGSSHVGGGGAGLTARSLMAGMRNDAGGAMDAVSIQDEPALRLAAMAHQGPYTGIGAVFEHLMAWGVGRGLVGPETRFIGLFLDDPASVPAERLRSNACMTVP